MPGSDLLDRVTSGSGLDLALDHPIQLQKGPLRLHLLQGADASLVRQVSDLLDNHDILDKPVWGLSDNNLFDVKSIYASQVSDVWDSESNCWKNIWSLPVPSEYVFSLGFPSKLLQRSVTRAQYFSECASWMLPIQCWQKSKPEWICLNTDGVISSSTGIGSVGGIFRADDGSWILGFNKTIRVLHPL
ncbi:hypothetical protein V6N11_019282 [Hibiscus sabdariffa]|uniref:Uncharacterized protein n=1 Tax=Hibiscus sabdariffa TaxID=183260 RepID=A0ABR2R2Q3_9ROSI